MAITEDRKVYPRLVALAGCLCEKLAEFGFDELCFCGVVSGEVADLTPVGSEGDMGWVRLTGITSIEEEQAARSCIVRLAAQFEVGFASCYPLEEEALSDVEQLELARTQLAGMQAAMQAILCCDWLPEGRGNKKMISLGTYTPLGPDGGVVGGVWTVALEL